MASCQGSACVGALGLTQLFKPLVDVLWDRPALRILDDLALRHRVGVDDVDAITDARADRGLALRALFGA